MIMAVALNHIHDYNNDWAVVVREHLGLSEYRLAEYWPSGDYHSVRLHNIVYFTQHLMASQLMDSDQFEREGLWHSGFIEIRKLEILNTEPELQHEFCDLWNEVMALAYDLHAS